MQVLHEWKLQECKLRFRMLSRHSVYPAVLHCREISAPSAMKGRELRRKKYASFINMRAAIRVQIVCTIMVSVVSAAYVCLLIGSNTHTHTRTRTHTLTHTHAHTHTHTHTPTHTGEFPCKFFHVKQYCRNGDNCKFSHAPLTAETEALLATVSHSPVFISQ